MKIQKNPVKGIIFDLDGTLLDSLPDIALSMNRVLQENGLEAYPLKSYNYFVGSGVKELLLRALPPSYHGKENLEKFAAAFREIYQQQWKENTRPFPEILSLLEKLKSSGLRMAILSNKPHDFTCRIAELCFPKNFFDTVRGAVESTPIKPHPAAALEISTQWNISPGNILFVGDTSVDMETARNSGMIPVGVSWGFRSRKELLDSGAQIILQKPGDLLDFFKELEISLS